MFLQICAFCCTLLYFGTYILNKLHGYWELNPFAIFERLKEDIWLQGRRKNHNWNQEEELIHYWWKMSSLFYRVRLSFKLFALPCLRRSGFIHLIGKNPSVKSDEKIKWWNYLPEYFWLTKQYFSQRIHFTNTRYMATGFFIVKCHFLYQNECFDLQPCDLKCETKLRLLRDCLKITFMCWRQQKM